MGGKDPVEGRLALLTGEPRHAGVLKRSPRWPTGAAAVPEGRARGVAVHKSFGTYVAQIAEVSRGEDGVPRVHKVWCRGRLRRRRSTRTSSARRWRAASATASARSSSTRSRSARAAGRAVELPRLSLAAHQRDAGGRGRDHRTRPSSRPASASPACRRSARRSPMPGAALTGQPVRRLPIVRRGVLTMS